MAAMETPLKTRRYATDSAYPSDHIINRVCDLVRGHVGSAQAICVRAGIPKDYLTAARRGERNPRILHIEAALNLCGYELTIRKRKDISEMGE